MLATLGGSLALLLGLVVLLVPLLTPELSRARDAVWGAVLLLLGLVLVTSADRLAGSPMVAVLCGGLVIGRLGSEVGQQRWRALTPEEQQRLGSGAHWRTALGQVLASLGALKGVASQSLSGLWKRRPLAASWAARSAAHQAPTAALAGAKRKGKGGQTKRWVRPEPGDNPGSPTGSEADAKGHPPSNPEPGEEPLEPATAPPEAIPAPIPGASKASPQEFSAEATSPGTSPNTSPNSDQGMGQASPEPLDDPMDQAPEPNEEPTVLPITPLLSETDKEASTATTTKNPAPPVIEVSSFAEIEAMVDAAWEDAAPQDQAPVDPHHAEAMAAPQDQATSPSNPVPPERFPQEPGPEPPGPAATAVRTEAG
jgi:hypothetical protein